MELWTEKYRPNTLDEYVWRDPQQRTQVEAWLKSGSLPHLLLSGVQGSGKTSLALLMLKELGVQKGDILEINASRERDPNVVATKILNFCSTWALGDMKYILLDEADSMTPLAQRILRGEMEKYHESVRFILTCNYPNKIIPALHSRCQGFHFEALDVQEFTIRLANILTAEGVALETEQDIELLNQFVELTHPDLRKCINLLQQSVVDGHLNPPQQSDSGGVDWMHDVVGLFRNGQFKEARTAIVSQATPEEYDDIYRFFYRNLDIWGADESVQNDALLIIRRGLVNHAAVADVEINLAATIVELCNLARG